MQNKKRKGRFLPLLLILVFIFALLYFIEEITPIMYINKINTQSLSNQNFIYLKKDTVFGVIADNNKLSLISREDLRNLKDKNLTIFLDENTPAYFEGNFDGKDIFISKDIKCKKIFSINDKKNTFFSKIRNLKFLLLYNIDKESAFYYEYKNLIKNLALTNFNPIKDVCFIAKNEAFIEEKFVKDSQKLTYPDVNYQINLIKNVIYIDKEPKKFYEKKYKYIEAINKGHSYTYFYKNPDINFFVKAGDNTYTFGDIINVKDNPVMYFYVKPKFITAVYINGKLKNYYKGSFSITPKSAGYYQFVVFDYKYNLLNLFFGFDIVAITNPVYFE